MRTYIVGVKWFNGRFWRSTTDRVEASSHATAAARAIRNIPKRFKNRERIEEVTVHTTALKKPKMPEPDGGSPSPEQG